MVRRSKGVWPRSVAMSFHLTIVASVSAAGYTIPPLFIFSGQRLNHDLLDDCVVEDAAVAVALKAFMTRTVFSKWLEHFSSMVLCSVDRPLLLINDGCASHFGPEIVSRAIEVKVFLVALPANVTHLLQPLDVVIFKPFKTSLRREIDKFVAVAGESRLTKKKAIEIASDAWQCGVLARPANAVAVFASTGLWPISLPRMMARKEQFSSGGKVSRENPVWLTVREELFFLPQAASASLVARV